MEPLDAPDIGALADCYVTKWKNTLNPDYWTGLPVPREEEDLDDWLDDALHDRPDDLWRFILAVLERDREGELLHVLSAGELEDLLYRHGPRVIERVEAEAGSNPRFATLLAGVWQAGIDEDVWRRVVAARDRRGWDGEPAPPDHWWMQAGAAEPGENEKSPP